MRKNRLSAVVIFSVLFFIPFFAAAEEYLFGTFPIPLMVIDEHSGVFVELTREIAKTSKFSVCIAVTPPIRTMKGFTKGKLDAIFPALDVNFPPEAEFERSESIYLKKDFVFTKKGALLFKTLDDLKDKRVGITRGYPYVNELINDTSIKLDIAASDEANARKLISGRIDAFVVEEKTGIKAFQNAGLGDKMQYDPSTPLSEQDVYYAFAGNPEGKMLAQKVSDAMKKMKVDGIFDQIMSKASQ